MLKKDLLEFNRNVFDELNFKWGIITAGDKTTKVNSMTVSWGGFGVLWNKYVCYIFVRKSRYTHDILDNTDSLTISFLTDEYKKEKIYMGRISGRDENKYEKSNLHITFDPDYNGYYIKEAQYAFKMKVIYKTDLLDLPKDIMDNFYKDFDDHTMYICEIKQYLENLE